MIPKGLTAAFGLAAALGLPCRPQEKYVLIEQDYRWLNSLSFKKRNTVMGGFPFYQTDKKCLLLKEMECQELAMGS